MNRREWLALGGLAIAGGCRRKKGSGYAGYAVVATAGDNSLTAIDLLDFRVFKTIPLSAPPTAVIPTANGYSYVLTPSTGTVYLLDGRLKPATSKRIGDEISELRLTGDGKSLIAIAEQARELIEIDPRTLGVLRRRRLKGKPTDLDLSTTNYVAVTSGESGTIEIFNLANGQGWATQAERPVGSVRFRSDGKLLLVANLKNRSMTVLNVPDLQVIADLQLAMAPENLCFTAPDAGQLFVSGAGMDAVVFPYGPLEVEQTVLAGGDPGVMACSGGPRYLFVANNHGSDVSILNVDDRKVIGVVAVGRKPGFITITPDNQFALVLNEGSGDMAVIHISAIRLDYRNRNSKTGAALFTMLPVGDRPVHAAVVPRQLV
jgi:YVTN family beta-propeller protein